MNLQRFRFSQSACRYSHERAHSPSFTTAEKAQHAGGFHHSARCSRWLTCLDCAPVRKSSAAFLRFQFKRQNSDRCDSSGCCEVKFMTTKENDLTGRPVNYRGRTIRAPWVTWPNDSRFSPPHAVPKSKFPCEIYIFISWIKQSHI